MYEINLNSFDQELIKRTNPNGTESWIPKDEGNADYQEYLKWLEEAHESL